MLPKLSYRGGVQTRRLCEEIIQQEPSGGSANAAGRAQEPQRATSNCGETTSGGDEQTQRTPNPYLYAEATRHGVTRHVLAITAILQQVSLLNPKLHLGVVNIC